jgi:hypothetical protein
MPRFRVTNLLVLTTVTAVYALLFRAVRHYPNGFACVELAVVVGFINWMFYRQHKVDVAMMREMDEQEKAGN